MSNILRILLIFIFISNCSLGEKSKFWKNDKNTQISDVEEVSTIEEIDEIGKKEKVFKSEFNSNIKINLSSKSIIKNKQKNNNTNNIGRINYSGNLNSISKFKFSKIKNFLQYSPALLFDDNDTIFFDSKGSIFKFDNDSNLIWKKNYYSKSEKKQNPVLTFAKNEKTLIVADNISKYYALDIDTGKILWMKKNMSPFNSQIKTIKGNFFIVDFENVLRAYSVKDGKEIWSSRTDSTLVRSQKKLSMVIIDNYVYFNNSLGDVSAIDIKTGELMWQRPTQSTESYENIYALENSEIISDNKNLYFSNNKNKFFSIDIKTGTINWQQTISSSLRPTLVEKYLFTISNDGFLIILDKDSGNVIRITNLFEEQSKKFLRSKKNKDAIVPVGFIVGIENIYLTTNKGKLYTINILTGKTIEILNIDAEKISQPFIKNQYLYIIKDNSIVKLD